MERGRKMLGALRRGRTSARADSPARTRFARVRRATQRGLLVTAHGELRPVALIILSPATLPPSLFSLPRRGLVDVLRRRARPARARASDNVRGGVRRDAAAGPMRSALGSSARLTPVLSSVGAARGPSPSHPPRRRLFPRRRRGRQRARPRASVPHCPRSSQRRLFSVTGHPPLPAHRHGHHEGHAPRRIRPPAGRRQPHAHQRHPQLSLLSPSVRSDSSSTSPAPQTLSTHGALSVTPALGRHPRPLPVITQPALSPRRPATPGGQRRSPIALTRVQTALPPPVPAARGPRSPISVSPSSPPFPGMPLPAHEVVSPSSSDPSAARAAR